MLESNQRNTLKVSEDFKWFVLTTLSMQKLWKVQE